MRTTMATSPQPGWRYVTANSMGRRVKSLLLVMVVLGCGGDGITEPEGELVLTPPPEPLTGTVIAADTFVVSATDVNFGAAVFQRRHPARKHRVGRRETLHPLAERHIEA